MKPFAAAGQAFEMAGSSMPLLGDVPPVSAGRRIVTFASGFTPVDVTPRQAHMCGQLLADTLAVKRCPIFLAGPP